MCGIIGYIGNQSAVDVLLEGLQRLEYRGYDSAGIATVTESGIQVRKIVGRVPQLVKRVQANPLAGSVGIGHTRWATHGEPSEVNAHPHLDASQRVAIVHNGVIENYRSLRTMLESHGHTFISETDSEIIPALICYHLQHTNHDLYTAVCAALRSIVGAYGLVILSAQHPDQLIAARLGSPLAIGIGQNEYLVASDATPFIGHTEQLMHLNDYEIAILSKQKWAIHHLDSGQQLPRIEALEQQSCDIGLAGYQHYMLKEIFDQPTCLQQTLAGRVKVNSSEVALGGLADAGHDELRACQQALLFGCGTAWHAAMVGKHLFENLAGLPTSTEYASELRYNSPIIQRGTLAIAISQSGETADTLAALKEIKSRGAIVRGVVNVVGSSIARETDAGVYLHAGPEIGVASTKAFTAQMAVLAMIAIYLGRQRHLSAERARAVLTALTTIPDKVAEVLALNDQIKELAGNLVDRHNWLYLGRGVNFPVALEGALKLKEISYIHAEGLPAAEIKHGPIALIDQGMPVVVVAPDDHTYKKVLVTMEEVRSRKGRVIAIVNQASAELSRLASDIIIVPPTVPILSPLITTVPLQLLAYHAAIWQGYDVDRPRNLAKSVTVE
jgi:glutamine---fructose-6-phosphate transaminase (isomerizing)